MSIELNSGEIIPSYLTLEHKCHSGAEKSYHDSLLRVGRVVGFLEPSDSKNKSKKHIEYTVSVDHMDGTGGLANMIYPNVTVASLFGGVADYLRWTPRIDNFDEGQQIGLGSRVLILCVNGNNRNAYIIGGVPHPNDTRIEGNFESNHHFDFEFNGVAANINSDGDFSLLHKGATNSAGSVIDSNGGNGLFSMNSDGSIILSYLQENTADNFPALILDKNNKTIKIEASSEIKAKTSSFTVNKGSLDYHPFVKATTYRTQEQVMHTTLSTNLQAISGLITAAGSALSLAAPLMIIPIAGPIVASPFVLLAGTSLITAGSLFTALQAAITSFELLSTTYLSQQHGFGEVPPIL